MRIFITGSSGFIGYHLSKKLLDLGNTVHGYDSMNNYYVLKLKKDRLRILKKYKNFSFTKGKLENHKLLKKTLLKFKPKIIIHLAAQAGVRYSIKNPDVYINSNIVGSFKLLEIVKKIKIDHLMIASSSSVYGANIKMPYSEKDRTDAQLSLYASTKKSVENISHAYSYLWKIPITMMRFFTVYGPWGRPDMALYTFTNKALKNKNIDIFNKGKMFRDFTYIDDVVSSIISLVKKKPLFVKGKKFSNDSISHVAPYRVVNIGNSKKIDLISFVNILEKKLGFKIKKNFVGLQKGDVKSTYSNNKLLNNLIKLKHTSNLSKGIQKFLSWYFDYYKKNKKNV